MSVEADQDEDVLDEPVRACPVCVREDDFIGFHTFEAEVIESFDEDRVGLKQDWVEFRCPSCKTEFAVRVNEREGSQ